MVVVFCFSLRSLRLCGEIVYISVFAVCFILPKQQPNNHVISTITIPQMIRRVLLIA